MFHIKIGAQCTIANVSVDQGGNLVEFLSTVLPFLNSTDEQEEFRFFVAKTDLYKSTPTDCVHTVAYTTLCSS